MTNPIIKRRRADELAFYNKRHKRRMRIKMIKKAIGIIMLLSVMPIILGVALYYDTHTLIGLYMGLWTDAFFGFVVLATYLIRG